MRQAAADCAAVAAAAAGGAAAAGEDVCANASVDAPNGCGCGCRSAAACRCSYANTTAKSRRPVPSSPEITRLRRRKVREATEMAWGNHLLHIAVPWCSSSRAIDRAAHPWT